METQHNEMKRPAPAPVTVPPSEADSISPSNAKIPRVWEPNSNELSNFVKRDATILDVLNADCWRLVLDYVSINDVVRSERVSRAWQRVVRDYLAGVHKYQILHSYENHRWWVSSVPSKTYRIINLSKREGFGNMIQKMGIFFVSMFARYIDEERMEAIAANCPNLNKLKIMLVVTPRIENLRLGLLKKCKQIKQLSLNLQNQGDDSSLNEVVTLDSLEELVINKHDLLSGSFLANLRTNLKTLIFVGCKSLVIEHVRSVADRLTGLTRLELSRNPIRILQNVHHLLYETPNLERLCLEFYQKQYLDLGIEVPTAISRLSRLKQLILWNNREVTDEWMAIVARGCPALRTVDVGHTRMTARGLLALCRARPALKELVICTSFVKDEDLEACARSCDGLELLDVSYCKHLTANLPARLAWPRARPLRLRIIRILAENTEVHYDGISLLWDNPGHRAWPD